MGRPLRPQIAGGVYHVFARGNRRQPLFLGNDDFVLFLALLRTSVRRYGWKCHSYCLIPNHYHLLLTTPDPNLSEGMHRLNSTYAHAFNDRHEVDGHTFQGRFGSRVIRSNADFIGVLRYIARNAIEAGLCADAADWRWSSLAATIGRRPRPDFLSTRWLVEQFGPTPAAAREAFDRYVHDDQLAMPS